MCGVGVLWRACGDQEQRSVVSSLLALGPGTGLRLVGLVASALAPVSVTVLNKTP